MVVVGGGVGIGPVEVTPGTDRGVHEASQTFGGILHGCPLALESGLSQKAREQVWYPGLPPTVHGNSPNVTVLYLLVYVLRSVLDTSGKL